MKIVTVVGARPQLIKAGAVSGLLKEFHDETIIHTGQHYDFNMSDSFIQELDIPMPSSNLSIGSGSHGLQTGKMIIGLENAFLHYKPDLILLYGDTNSTLAATIAGVKLGIPIAHVEAGVRAYIPNNPEEINRVLTDRVSSYLFCPSQTGVNNLTKENSTGQIYFTGDVMVDLLFHNIKKNSNIKEELGLNEYIYMTIHRQENTTPEVMNIIMDQVSRIDKKIVFSIHPRTAKVKFVVPYNVTIIPPVGYVDSIHLQKGAEMVITDSGGVQKEAYCLKVPGIIIMEKTTWTETVELGWNKLSKPGDIFKTYSEGHVIKDHINCYGDGNAVEKIIEILNRI